MTEQKNVGPFLAFNELFFVKHQRGLLWLLNHPLTKRWFRWVLRIRKADPGYLREIVWLLPDCYHARGDKPGEFIADFRTHPKFGKRLYYAFRPLWWLIHFWDWAVADRLTPQWSYGFATLTAYPDPDPETTTVDGKALRSVTDEDFSVIRAGAGTSAQDDDATAEVLLISGPTTDKFNVLQRVIMLFNTSSLGSGATATAATLSLFGVSKDNGLGSDALHTCSSTPASNTAIVAGDYANVGSTSFGSVAYAGFSTSAYNDVTLNASGIAAVSVTGISKFGARLGWDISNSFSGSWSGTVVTQLTFRSAERTGTSEDPKLVVTYTPNPNVTVTPSVLTAILSVLGASILTTSFYSDKYTTRGTIYNDKYV